MLRIAVLNSGGDSPGMNAAVASVARSANLYDMPLVGIIRGYNGIIRQDDSLLDAFFLHAREVAADNRQELDLLERVEAAIRHEADANVPDIRPFLDKYGDRLALTATIQEFLQQFPAFQSDMRHLDQETILDINNLPGSYLRTARCEAFKREVIRLRAVINLVAAGIGGLVVIGGDGSFRGATLLCQMGMPCIGIPGTIDNDLAYTEMTLGYDTACNHCLRAVLEVRSTSRAHDRPHVVEVMGRDRGDIALKTAMASGAEILLVREVEWSVDEVAKRLQSLIDRGNYRATVVISEGAYDSMQPFDLYGYLRPIYDMSNRKLLPDQQHKIKKVWYEQTMDCFRLAEVLNYKCRNPGDVRPEVRATRLGYTQRGGEPSSYDAAFAFEAGNMAVRLLVDGREDLVIGVKEGRVYSLSINDAFSMQPMRDDYFNFTMYNLVNQF